MHRNKTQSRTKKNKKSDGTHLTPGIAIAGVLGLALAIYIAYKTATNERNFFSVSLIALFAGLLFESFRVSNNWKTVIAIFIGTFFFSLFSLMPGKREQHYSFENHLRYLPYVFLFVFTIAFALFHKDRLTLKLTEGITLLLSLSFIYWTIDYGLKNCHNWFVITLLIIAFLFSALSIVNALTSIHLSKGMRLTLSIWSTVMMFAFAIDNIMRVFSSPDIESTTYVSDGLYIGLQYFLLGVSAVYIMHHYIMLVAFLPSKNGNYRRDLREIKKDHIDRYSDQQTPIRYSLLCILYTVAIYWMNYTYHILPRHTMIWLVIVTFPLILQMTNISPARRSLRLSRNGKQSPD